MGGVPVPNLVIKEWKQGGELAGLGKTQEWNRTNVLVLPKIVVLARKKNVLRSIIPGDLGQALPGAQKIVVVGTSTVPGRVIALIIRVRSAKTIALIVFMEHPRNIFSAIYLHVRTKFFTYKNIYYETNHSQYIKQNALRMNIKHIRWQQLLHFGKFNFDSF